MTLLGLLSQPKNWVLKTFRKYAEFATWLLSWPHFDSIYWTWFKIMDFGFISENAATTTTASPQNPSCMKDNTLYFRDSRIYEDTYDHYYLENSSVCQELCERKRRCQFWTFHRDGHLNRKICFLMERKIGDYAKKGYLSGSKYCHHVSLGFKIVVNKISLSS